MIEVCTICVLWIKIFNYLKKIKKEKEGKNKERIKLKLKADINKWKKIARV